MSVSSFLKLPKNAVLTKVSPEVAERLERQRKLKQGLAIQKNHDVQREIKPINVFKNTVLSSRKGKFTIQ